MSLIGELKRRNVFRVAAAYAVASWLLIQVAETIFPLFGFDDTPARIVVIVLGIGFIPAVVFAWAFELTPEGLKEDKDVDHSQPIAALAAKKVDRLIMVALAIALCFFAFDKFVLDPGRAAEQEQKIAALEEQRADEIESTRRAVRSAAVADSYGDRSIAVLPFVNMSSDAEQEYFSDGITEEVLNLLARIPELRVISRSSAFSFKGRDVTIPEIAESLNVAHILEGSVRKAGDRVRITAQLIEARSDRHLWSETYDRTLDDIFAIQDEIAGTVVAQLKITLLGDAPQARQADPEAYSLVLQARHLRRLNTAEGLEQSVALYKQALAIDPDYAGAWGGLAASYRNQASNGLVPADDGNTLARAAAEKALAIDPDYAPARAALGSIAMEYDGDLAEAAQHFERALELDPANIGIIGQSAALLFALGRLDESILLEEFVTARDPVGATGYYSLGSSYLFAGRWKEAIDAYQTALRLSPGFLGAHYRIGESLLFQGAPDAALKEFAQTVDEQWRVKGEAMALYSLGRQDDYKARLAELIQRWGGEWPSEVAQLYAWTGNTDEAFSWLEAAIVQKEPGLNQLYLNRFFEGIQSDPRWEQFRERTGASQEKLDAIEFAVTLP